MEFGLFNFFKGKRGLGSPFFGNVLSFCINMLVQFDKDPSLEFTTMYASLDDQVRLTV